MILDRIKKLCDEQGISVAELCRRAGVSYETVKEWNRCFPTLNNLAPIAKELGVDITTLAWGDGDGQ